ncbi:hypothetical protein [Nitrospirillum viridazoti]|uniref:Uncharacterized protein n=1 Tax=Nitrospirillum amazonense TaxID=28077 RepID=A0A560IPY3_9PROT|nr:hypothetical protein [Nitrospirillum amazonense]TWB58710.1 hypothetical protein FBZ92_109203 [Nitrospirillum amazonense]
MSKQVTLADCPPGLFLFQGYLGFKSEYSICHAETKLPLGPEAYVVASGEIFWGGASSHEARKALLVIPIDVSTLIACREHDPYAKGGDAFIAGTPETANPYAPGSDDHLSWNDGWHSFAALSDDED